MSRPPGNERRSPDVRLSVLLLAALFAAPAALGTALLTAHSPEERFPAAGDLRVGGAAGPPQSGLDAGAGDVVGEAAEGTREEEGATRADH